MLKQLNWKLILPPLIILGVIAYIAWTIYDYGRYRAGFDQKAVEREQQVLEDRIEQLEDQLSESRAKVARLESAKKVDSYANDAVRETLTKMEADSQELREELQFFRTIVSPSKGRRGIHIHEFNINQAQNGQYIYSMTLIHIQGPKKHHRQSDGEVKLSIEGTQNGVKKKLEYANINTAKRSKIRYRFKYFARLQGGLKLPDKFKPEAIEITVKPRQSKIKGDSKRIKWPGAVS